MNKSTDLYLEWKLVWKKKQIGHGHFCPLNSHIFSLQFSLYFGEKTFLVISEKKHLGPIIYFLFSTLNQTHSKNVFLLIFSPKFFIHPISPPNKHTQSVNHHYLCMQWLKIVCAFSLKKKNVCSFDLSLWVVHFCLIG